MKHQSKHHFADFLEPAFLLVAGNFAADFAFDFGAADLDLGAAVLVFAAADFGFDLVTGLTGASVVTSDP
jgi:hypothetical protein